MVVLKVSVERDIVSRTIRVEKGTKKDKLGIDVYNGHLLTEEEFNEVRNIMLQYVSNWNKIVMKIPKHIIKDYQTYRDMYDFIRGKDIQLPKPVYRRIKLLKRLGRLIDVTLRTRRTIEVDTFNVDEITKKVQGIVQMTLTSKEVEKILINEELEKLNRHIKQTVVKFLTQPGYKNGTIGVYDDTFVNVIEEGNIRLKLQTKITITMNVGELKVDENVKQIILRKLNEELGVVIGDFNTIDELSKKLEEKGITIERKFYLGLLSSLLI